MVLTQDVYVGNEGTVVEVCAELESTTGGQPLSASQFVSVSTTPDTATATRMYTNGDTYILTHIT